MKEKTIPADKVEDFNLCPECGTEVEWMDVENFDDYEMHHFYCPKCGVQGAVEYDKIFVGITYLVNNEKDSNKKKDSNKIFSAYDIEDLKGV